MNTRFPLVVASLALACVLAFPAFAGDGDKDKPTPAPASGGECKEEKKECGEKKECPEKKECCGEKKECCGDAAAKECQEKQACSDLEVVTLAAVEGTSEVAKKVLASVPAASMEKVEAARKVALEQLAAIHGSMVELKKGFDGHCAEAKAKGVEACSEMKATFEKDMKALHVKAKESIELCSKQVAAAIGEGKIKELSADCRKAGDMAQAVMGRIKDAAAKLVESKKAGECGECEIDVGGCVETKDAKKPEEKKGEEKKPETKDAK